MYIIGRSRNRGRKEELFGQGKCILQMIGVKSVKDREAHYNLKVTLGTEQESPKHRQRRESIQLEKEVS